VTEGKLKTGFMMPAHAVSLLEIKRVWTMGKTISTYCWQTCINEGI